LSPVALSHRQSPQDVCFIFPRLNAKLWAWLQVLVDQSAYYDALLRGQLSESTVHTGTGSTVPEPGSPSHLFEDSDDETDEQLKVSIGQRACSTSSTSQPHKEVVITDTAFTTYEATLVWMSSRFIRFAPFRSRKAENDGAAVSEPGSPATVKMVEADPETPLPASPKSVYRLAHVLELEDLQEIALKSIYTQLTIRNAATELFSDVAYVYPAVRDTILDFVVAHWTEIRYSNAYKKIKERADAGDLPTGATHIALLLSERMEAPQVFAGESCAFD
jgi:hypothetical protein